MKDRASKTGVHEDFSRSGEVKRGSDRSFGFVFVGFFSLLALAPLRHHEPVRLWAFAVASAFLLVTLVRPSLLRPLNWFWFHVGAVLHRITNPIILGVIFFVVITPMAIVFRLVGKRLLKLRIDPAASSYWVRRTPAGPAPETMSRAF